MKLANVLAEIGRYPWAILPGKLEAILEVVSVNAAGGSMPKYEAAAPRVPMTQGGVAIIPVYGVMSQRMNMITDASGGTSTDLLGFQFESALKDPSVKGIVFDVDSPGGNVYGVTELAAKIRAGRGQKRIVAVANSLAASAAYWIASAADEVFVTASGEVGAIGILSVRPDTSGAEGGVKYTVISAGKYKAEGIDTIAPTDAELAHRQARVDDYYSLFTKDVAAGRGVSVDQVVDGFGEGRVVGAKDAVKLGMADRVGGLVDAVTRAGQRFTSRLDQSRQVALLAKTADAY